MAGPLSPCPVSTCETMHAFNSITAHLRASHRYSLAKIDELKKNMIERLKNPQPSYKCPYCFYPLQWKSTLIKHIYRLHLVDGSPRYAAEASHKRYGKYAVFPLTCCDICDQDLYIHGQFSKHFIHYHNEKKYASQWISFSNLDEFKKWKEAIEVKSNTAFTRVRKESSQSEDEYFFRCNREKLPNQDAKNTDNLIKVTDFCSAFMKVRALKGSEVNVEYCIEHYGHPVDARYLPLTNLDKREILKLLKKDLSNKEIIQKFRKDYKNVKNRLYHLQFNTLFYIRSRMDTIEKEIYEYENGGCKYIGYKRKRINDPLEESYFTSVKADDGHGRRKIDVREENETPSNNQLIENKRELDTDDKDTLSFQCDLIVSNVNEMLNGLKSEIAKYQENRNDAFLKCLESDISLVVAKHVKAQKRIPVALLQEAEKRPRLEQH